MRQADDNLNQNRIQKVIICVVAPEQLKPTPAGEHVIGCGLIDRYRLMYRSITAHGKAQQGTQCGEYVFRKPATGNQGPQTFLLNLPRFC
jgi:hypothetical protein